MRPLLAFAVRWWNREDKLISFAVRWWLGDDKLGKVVINQETEIRKLRYDLKEAEDRRAWCSIELSKTINEYVELQEAARSVFRPLGLWESIDNAPVEKLLLTWATTENTAHPSQPRIGYCTRGVWRDQYSGQPLTPTHWMPLPDSPKAG